LRVEGAGDDRDGPVLAGGIDPLQNDEDGVFVLGVDPLLKVGQTRQIGRDGCFESLFFPTECRAAVESGEIDPGSGFTSSCLRRLWSLSPPPFAPIAASRT